VFVVLFAPLIAWLVAHDFLPLKYAAARGAQSRVGGVPLFLLSVALNLAGMLAMLAIAGLAWPWRGSSRVASAPEPPPLAVAPRALAYLVAVTAGPLAIAMVAALIAGSNLKSAWGSSMFNFAGVLAVALASARFDGRALRRIALSAACLLAVVPAAYAVVIAAGPSRAGAPVRVTWPQAAISKRFAAIWAKETGRPLRIVAGDDWVAGLVGLTARDRPSILNRGNTAYSPWITPERIERQGMLIVWEEGSRKIPPPLQALVEARPAREERFNWKRAEGRGDLVIGYAIVAPK
jgi:hypothetical protein